MTTFDSLLQRNQAYAAEQFASGAPQATTLASLSATLKTLARACIITCVDMRVDPAHVLGIRPGEAIVIRNIGGRVTPDTLEQMELLGRVAEVAQANPGGGDEFHLIVLQHTDCGITRLNGDPELLARYFAVAPADLAAKSIMDPRAAVAGDVAVLKNSPAIPGAWLVSGLVYDVETGRVEVVVPPAPVRSSAAAGA